MHDGLSLTAPGVVRPYSWSAAGLPPGINVNAQTGDLFGTPALPGSYTIPVTLADSGVPQVTEPMTYTIAINNPRPPAISATPAPGPMPNADGVFSGTPTTAGTFSYTLIAEDMFKQDSAPQGFSIQIFAHGFKLTGSMAGPCIAHSATWLGTGKVLVAGGTDGSGIALASAELYDPATGTFSATGSMATAREGASYTNSTTANNASAYF